MAGDARRLEGAALAAALRDSRSTTLARTMDVAAWPVPRGPGVNPVAWELGHLAWFAEFWILRGPHSIGASGFVDAARPPRRCGPDAIFDSARLAHADRWDAPLPSRSELVERLAAQLEACVESVVPGGDDAANYFHRLALFHEDMHGEAFAWLRAALGWPAPAGLEAMPVVAAGEPLRVDGGEVEIGRTTEAPGFSFDNELPAQRLRIAPFEIDASPVSNGQFLEFVSAGGYDEASFWPGEAGAWRSSPGRAQPQRWRHGDGAGWQARWFDRWLPLVPDAPVVHVNAWEAEAYCRWAGRRLPSAAEWELAAREPGFRWGRSVWEWTGDAFRPYPGFVPGPYRDYSQPWFGDHRELRGGSIATHDRLHHPCYRNFFTPDRSDVFAGFRTAALPR
ncbi:MAG: selenoneine synthase SenA [Caldimonas sp.]